MHLGRRHIIVKRLGLWRGATTGAKAKDLYDPHVGLLVKGQHIADTHGAGGFHGDVAANPYLACGHGRGCDRARFEKPRLPQPLIKPNGFAFLAQPFLSAASAANGLSGSIFFSAFGLALNFCR